MHDSSGNVVAAGEMESGNKLGRWNSDTFPTITNMKRVAQSTVVAMEVFKLESGKLADGMDGEITWSDW